MIPRNITSDVLAALSDTPVVVLHGARQTGKSTLVREIAKDCGAQYITLDDATALSAVRADAAGFLLNINGPVVIDEIQRAPDLLVAIKAEVDRKRTAGRFLLTGSANVLTMPRISESLAGRMEIQTLWPFSQGELARTKEGFIDAAFSRKALRVPDARKRKYKLSDLLLTGGYPPAIARPSFDRRRAWYGSYITTILDRDLRDLANIESLTQLPRLLSLIAARTGTLLNFADLARAAALPQTTLKRYFSLFETTFLVLAFANAFTYALVASRARGFVSNPRAIRVINRTGGGLLIGAGVATVSWRT